MLLPGPQPAMPAAARQPTVRDTTTMTPTIPPAETGGEDEVAKLTGWEQATNPILNITSCKIITRGDNTTLVQAAIELHNNLARAVVVHKFKLSNVAVFHHDLQKLDNHLG